LAASAGQEQPKIVAAAKLDSGGPVQSGRAVTAMAPNMTVLLWVLTSQAAYLAGFVAPRLGWAPDVMSATFLDMPT
jgi:hypothetical protein